MNWINAQRVTHIPAVMPDLPAAEAESDQQTSGHNQAVDEVFGHQDIDLPAPLKGVVKSVGDDPDPDPGGSEQQPEDTFFESLLSGDWQKSRPPRLP